MEVHQPTDVLRKHLENASKIVNDWPEWKRGILAGTTKSMKTKPREVVEADETEPQE